MALARGIRWGGELAFPYGPLGALVHSRYEPDASGLAQGIWELGIKGLLSALCAAFVLRRGSSAWSAGIFLALLLALPGGPDLLLFAAIAVAASYALGGERRRATEHFLVAALLGTLALTKFTLFVYSAFACMTLMSAAWRGERRTAGAAAIGWGSGLLGTWIACGQHPLDLPVYVRSSLWLVSGHSEAMSLVGSTGQIVVSLLALVLAGAYILARARDPLPGRGLASTALLGAGLFLTWKAGFTRHADGPLTFFGFCALMPFLGARAEYGTRGSRAELLRRGLALACTALALLGIALTLPTPRAYPLRLWLRFREIPRKLVELSRPGEIGLVRASEREALAAEHDLPRVRAEVGDAPVDLVGSRQGVLFLNGLAWKPRPAFQSYLAYTPELLRADEAFFASEQAPRYVLWSEDAIDGRVPSGADVLVLLRLFADYEPLFFERGFLLWERREGPSRPLPRPRVLEAGTLRFDEVIALGFEPGVDLRRLVIELVPTVLGRVAGSAYQIPPVWIELAFDDGSRARQRLIPAVAREGFPVEPVLSSAGDWRRRFEGAPGRRVIAIRLEGESFAESCFPASMGWRVEELPGLSVPGALRDPERGPFELWKSPPRALRLEGEAAARQVGDRPAVILRAPAELAFDAPVGRTRFAATVALHPAVARAGAGDGMWVRLLLRERDEVESELAALELAPGDPTSVELRELAVVVDVPEGGEIVLRLDPGASADARGDVLVIPELALEPWRSDSR